MNKTQHILPVVLILLLLALINLRGISYAEPFQQSEVFTARTLYYKDINSSYERFKRIIAATPENQQIRMDLIRILREKGEYKEAIAHLKILAEQEPKDHRYRAALLETTFLAGQPEEAVRLATTPILGNAADLTANELFWKGLALADVGEEIAAIQALTDSIAKEQFNPMAYYTLGGLYAKTGNYENAVINYKKAAAQDPNMDRIYLPLAQAYIELEKYLTAYHYLLTARDEAPWNHEIAVNMKKLAAAHPEMFHQQTTVQNQRQPTELPSVTPILDDREKIPEIRIGLAEKIKRLCLETGDSFRLIDQTGKVRFSGKARRVLIVKQSGRRIEIYNRWGTRLFRSGNSIVLSYKNPAATTLLYEVQYVEGSFWAGRGKRIYRGQIQFSPRSAGLTMINRINLEEYLYGVIPMEMEHQWPTEALEAQAIAARTYAISHKNSFNSRGFDLLPTTASQVYGGVLAERTSTNAAVDATRGQILTYNNKPISAFYTGNDGGYSASSQDIWGIDVPYLQAVPDKMLPPLIQPLGPENLAQWLTSRPPTYSCNPQYSAPSHYRWTLWIPRQEIERRLKLGDKLGRITSIIVTERSVSGVATEVVINGTNDKYVAAGDAIRTKLGGLYSNMFIVQPKLGADGLPEYFIFNGGGWGHGVGLCQSGAAGMAADGYKCEEILSHYYSGAELTQLYQ